MSQWNERYKDHPIWKTLDDVGPAIDQAMARDGNDAQAAEMLSRLKAVHIFTARRLAGADRYLLTVDRMELNSQDRPKVDGLPVPALEPSAGACQQSGNFAKLQVSSITCVATDERGQQYRLQFESDGAPLTLRRVRASAPTIRQDPYF